VILVVAALGAIGIAVGIARELARQRIHAPLRLHGVRLSASRSVLALVFDSMTTVFLGSVRPAGRTPADSDHHNENGRSGPEGRAVSHGLRHDDTCRFRPRSRRITPPGATAAPLPTAGVDGRTPRVSPRHRPGDELVSARPWRGTIVWLGGQRPLGASAVFGWMVNAMRSAGSSAGALLFTAMILAALSAVGSWLPAPGGRSGRGQQLRQLEGGSTIFGLLNLLSGSSLSRLSLFSHSESSPTSRAFHRRPAPDLPPCPSLEQLQRQGEAGLREAESVHALRHWFAFAAAQANRVCVPVQTTRARSHLKRPAASSSSSLTLTAGTTLLMWFGEQDHQARRRQRHLDPDLRPRSSRAHQPAFAPGSTGSADLNTFFFSDRRPCSSSSPSSSCRKGSRKIPIQYARRVVGRAERRGGRNQRTCPLRS